MHNTEENMMGAQDASVTQGCALPVKRTKIGVYRRMKVVAWEGGRPVKRDHKGNAWMLSRIYGVGCCELTHVSEYESAYELDRRAS